MRTALPFVIAAGLLSASLSGLQAAPGDSNPAPAIEPPAGDKTGKPPLKWEKIPLHYVDAQSLAELLGSLRHDMPSGMPVDLQRPRKPYLTGRPTADGMLPGLEPRLRMPVLSLPLLSGVTTEPAKGDPNALLLKGSSQALDSVRSAVKAARGTPAAVDVAVELFSAAAVPAGPNLPPALVERGFITGDEAAGLARVLKAAKSARHLPVIAACHATVLNGDEAMVATGLAGVAAGPPPKSSPYSVPPLPLAGGRGLHWIRVQPYADPRGISASIQIFAGERDGGTYDGRLAMHNLSVPDGGQAVLYIAGSERAPDCLYAVVTLKTGTGKGQ